MALDSFILGTVLEPTFTKLKKVNGEWTETDIVFTLDSLKISNITEEGPEKTARGGVNNRILARHGKTARLEMEDAVGTTSALNYLLGAHVKVEKENNRYVIDTEEVTINAVVKKDRKHIFLPTPVTLDGSAAASDHGLTVTTGGVSAAHTIIKEGDLGFVIKLNTPSDSNSKIYTVKYKPLKNAYFSVTDTYPGFFKIEGDTYAINTNGKREYLRFTIHRFLPDGLLNLSMESEGDFGVIELGGEMFTKCGAFYTIGELEDGCKDPVSSEGEATPFGIPDDEEEEGDLF